MSIQLQNFIKATKDAGYEFEDDIEIVLEFETSFLFISENNSEKDESYFVGRFDKTYQDFSSGNLFAGTLPECLSFMGDY